LKSSIEKCKNSSIEAQLVEIPPNKIDIEELYSKINIEPSNASFKVENKNIIIEPHKKGSETRYQYLLRLARERSIKLGAKDSIQYIMKGRTISS
jgi:hypothetical protein